MSKNDYIVNGERSASPAAHPSEDFRLVESGLTKREHFAAMAMQGLIANVTTDPKAQTRVTFDPLAKCAAQYADALLKALEES